MLIRTKTNTYVLSFERECICYLSPSSYTMDDEAQLVVGFDNSDVDIYSILDFPTTPKEYIKQRNNYRQERGIGIASPKFALPSFSANEIEQLFFNTPEIVFEITEACNLECRYCVYGQMYNNSNGRAANFLTADFIIAAISELLCNRAIDKDKLCVGFYGGEPLIRFNDLKTVVEYCEQNFSTITFQWLITTNATLLTNDIITFLIAHNVDLLISLDGDRHANKNRIFKNGMESFDTVLEKIALIENNNPEYFSKYVNFSAVHSIPTIAANSIIKFFEQKFHKTPLLSNLTSVGATDETKEIISSQIEEQLTVPTPRDIISFIGNLTHNITPDIQSLIKKSEIKKCQSPIKNSKAITFRPTGTCAPFGKKIFITATGDIKPCEKIPLDFSFGKFDGKKYVINFADVASYYNRLYGNLICECNECHNKWNCSFCMFHIPNILYSDTPHCPRKIDNETAAAFYGQICETLEEAPELYYSYSQIKYE